MENRFALCSTNYLDTATLVASVSMLLPLSNVQDPLPQRVTRANATTFNITADLGAAKAVEAMIVYFTNLTATATINFRSSTDNFASDNTLEAQITVGTLGYQVPLVFIPGAAINKRYFRFGFVDSSNPDGYIDVGHLFIGPASQAAANINFDWQLASVSEGKIERGAQGAGHLQPGARWRRVEAQVAPLTDSQGISTLFGLLYPLHNEKPVYLLLDPLNSDVRLRGEQSFFGVFTQIPQLQQPAANLIIPGRFVFEEV